jgi:hypothetical protein
MPQHSKHSPRLLVDINVWGPSAWKFLHAVSFTIPKAPTDNEQKKYRSFFQSLTNVLPCGNCRNHLVENYELDPIDVSSTRACSEWMYRIHNAVNVQTGKPILTSYFELVVNALPRQMWSNINPSLAETKEMEEIKKHQSSPDGVDWAMIWWIIIVVALVVLLVVVLVLVCINKSRAMAIAKSMSSIGSSSFAVSE